MHENTDYSGCIVTPVRPNRDQNLLNLGDIKPGLRVQRWRDGTKAETQTIASFPYFDHQIANTPDSIMCNTIWVDVESPYSYEGAGRHSLADMGIVAYEHGVWHKHHYATVAEPLTPKSIAANSTVDFFRSVGAWLDDLDNSGSEYRHECRVEVVIPDELRHVVVPHSTVQVVNGLCFKRNVTVSFIHA